MSPTKRNASESSKSTQKAFKQRKFEKPWMEASNIAPRVLHSMFLTSQPIQITIWEWRPSLVLTSVSLLEIQGNPRDTACKHDMYGSDFHLFHVYFIIVLHVTILRSLLYISAHLMSQQHKLWVWVHWKRRVNLVVRAIAGTAWQVRVLSWGVKLSRANWPNPCLKAEWPTLNYKLKIWYWWKHGLSKK